jgi:ATP-dependent Clp protease protease subunit
MRNLINLVGSVDEIMYEKVLESLVGLDIQKVKGLTVTINSEGGSFSDALAIYGLLTTTFGDITTIAYGNCHSAAVTVFLAGKERLCSEDTKFLMHDEISKAKGTAVDMIRQAKRIADEDHHYNEILTRHTHTPVVKWAKLCKDEVWLTAKEAVKLNLVTHILKRK